MNNNGLFTVEGLVLENLPNTQFRVKVTRPDLSVPELQDQIVLCHLSGKMRRNYVRLLPGDKVRCEISHLDKSLGRVVFKLK